MKGYFAFGLLLATSLAMAVPTQFGFSGGFTVPTAEIQQGVSLTMLVDKNENVIAFVNGQYIQATNQIPKTLLSFNPGKSLELCIGYQRQELDIPPVPGPFPQGAQLSFPTAMISLKYALPWTFHGGALAVGAEYETTDVSTAGEGPFGDETFTRWIGLLSGTFPVFDKETTFTTSVMFASEASSDWTSYGFNLERRLPNKGAVGVEYILNSPNFYRPAENDFGAVYVTMPFGDMFTSRLALTGMNVDVDLAYSLTATF